MTTFRAAKRSGTPRGLRWRSANALLFFILSTAVLAQSPERLLNLGHADQAAVILKQQLAINPADGQAHLLLCRVFLSEQLASQASAECASALNTLPNSVNAQIWAGRAFGLEASHAGPFAGLKLARRVKNAFARAVELAPTNPAALNDLAEYLIAAPGIVGGSLPDALALADRIAPTQPALADRIRALAAEKSHDPASAERHFRAAADLAHAPAALVDLANFYARQHRPDDAVATLKAAIAANTARDSSLFDAASILTDLHRDPALAISALRSYLSGPSLSDAVPAFRAEVLFGRLLAAAGDKPAARTEFNTALSLAHDFAPAQKALAAL